MLYKYKSDKIIQDVVVDNLSVIVDDIVDEFKHLRRDEFICVYCPAKIGKMLMYPLVNELQELKQDEESDLNILQSEKLDVLITLGYDDMIYVEEARGKGGCLRLGDAAINYIYDSFPEKDVSELAQRGFEMPILIWGLKQKAICKEDFRMDSEKPKMTEGKSKPETDKSDKDDVKISLQVNGKQLDDDEIKKLIDDLIKDPLESYTNYICDIPYYDFISRLPFWYRPSLWF